MLGKLAEIFGTKRSRVTTSVALTKGGNGMVVVRWGRGFVNVALIQRDTRWVYQLMERDTVVGEGTARSRSEAIAQGVAEAMEWLL